VYVNDGRQHLQMQRTASYDLIALEPPPIAYAGVAALYSREFYTLARARLKPKGFISQWLPVYQVPAATTLAMIRAFIDVFPHAVLVSGADADLLLVGANDSPIEIDPARVAAALSRAPAVQADLQRLDLGSVREIVGTFLGSAQKLAEASRDSAPVSDDRPIQEYGVKSLLTFGDGVPAAAVDLSQVGAWCPTCFADGKPVPLVEGLDTYFALLERAYSATPAEVGRTRALADQHTRLIEGSAYLGVMVPESADLHNILGAAFAARGKFDRAIEEFREAVQLNPSDGRAHYDLAGMLLEARQYEDAVAEFRAALRLMPNSVEGHDSLGIALASRGKLDEAIDEFRAALRLMPESVKARNNLGIALASQGKLDEAIGEFQQALAAHPESTEARRNLTTALQRRGR
jgi:tetratricopeptide (TPR) repeat protein